MSRLNLHLVVLRTQTANLEEDQEVDEAALDVLRDAGITEPLSIYITYASSSGYADPQLTFLPNLVNSRTSIDSCVEINQRSKVLAAACR